jgi:hypothetical protein
MARANIGFHPVIAIDTSAKLLAELEARAAGRAIQTTLADLGALPHLVPPESASLVASMGDTSAPVPGTDAVGKLFADSYQALGAGGWIVLTVRDLTPAAAGLDRFIPVRSDTDRIMTCWESPEGVVVRDLLYVRNGSDWALRKSSDRKPRLARKWVCEELTAVGLRVKRNKQAGRLWSATAAKER